MMRPCVVSGLIAALSATALGQFVGPAVRVNALHSGIYHYRSR